MLGIFFVFFFVENCVYLEVSRKNEFITVFIVYAMFMIRNMVRVLSSVRVYAICLCCCFVFFFFERKKVLATCGADCMYLFAGEEFLWNALSLGVCLFICYLFSLILFEM